jgi:hypothetical protein
MTSPPIPPRRAGRRRHPCAPPWGRLLLVTTLALVALVGPRASADGGDTDVLDGGAFGLSGEDAVLAERSQTAPDEQAPAAGPPTLEGAGEGDAPATGADLQLPDPADQANHGTPAGAEQPGDPDGQIAAQQAQPGQPEEQAQVREDVAMWPDGSESPGLPPPGNLAATVPPNGNGDGRGESGRGESEQPQPLSSLPPDQQAAFIEASLAGFRVWLDYLRAHPDADAADREVRVGIIEQQLGEFGEVLDGMLGSGEVGDAQLVARLAELREVVDDQRAELADNVTGRALDRITADYYDAHLEGDEPRLRAALAEVEQLERGRDTARLPGQHARLTWLKDAIRHALGTLRMTIVEVEPPLTSGRSRGHRPVVVPTLPPTGGSTPDRGIPHTGAAAERPFAGPDPYDGGGPGEVTVGIPPTTATPGWAPYLRPALLAGAAALGAGVIVLAPKLLALAGGTVACGPVCGITLAVVTP